MSGAALDGTMCNIDERDSNSNGPSNATHFKVQARVERANPLGAGSVTGGAACHLG